MQHFIQAFELGQEQAVRDNLSKEASAADVATILKALSEQGSSALSGLGKALQGAKKIGTKAKYLGTMADPRTALLVGGGGGLAALTKSKDIADVAAHVLPEELASAVPGSLATLGAGLAMGANPGMLGGSMSIGMSHELAMQARTPAGLIGTMASVVGLPAALIAYGKIKGKEEASLF